MMPYVPWYKKIPCWFGKHDWHFYDEPLTGGRIHAHRECKYCYKNEITWINYTAEGW